MARKPKPSPETGAVGMPDDQTSADAAEFAAALEGEVHPLQEKAPSEVDKILGEIEAQAVADADAMQETQPAEEDPAAEPDPAAEIAQEAAEFEAACGAAGVDPEADQWNEAVDRAGADDAPDFNPELDSLLGDMRDAMLQRIRTLQKPWQQMSQRDQTDTVNGIELAAKAILRKTVRLLNAYEWPHAAVSLGEVKIKGGKGIEAKITTPNTFDSREVLGNHVGEMVMILMVDSETFHGERNKVQIALDQPPLPFDRPVPETPAASIPAAEEVDTSAPAADPEPSAEPAAEDPEALGGAPALIPDEDPGEQEDPSGYVPGDDCRDDVEGVA